MTLLSQTWTMSAVYLSIISTELTSDTTNIENLESHKYSSFITWDSIFILAGYVTSSLLMDRIGRRLTYIMGITPGLVSSILINFNNTQIDTIRRALSSFSFGTTNILGVIIIGEYTSPKYRGNFLNLLTTSMFFGQMSRLILNCHFQSSTIINFTIILQMLSLGITLTWPKSPYWLILKERYKEFQTSFVWLRGVNEDSLQEKHDLLSRDQRMPVQSKFTRFCRTFTSREFRSPMTIVVFGAILAEASGRHYLPIFASDFFTTIMNETSSQKIYISIVFALSSSMTLPLLSLFRNRKLLLTTGFFSITAAFIGSIFVFLITYKAVSSNSSWIGVFPILLYVVCSNLGVTSIPIALIGEVLPLENKAFGSLISGVVTSSVSWSAVKIAACLLEAVHLHGTLGIFGILMTFSLLVLFVILPETKGRSLPEIEEYFNRGWYSEDGCDDDEIRLTLP